MKSYAMIFLAFVMGMLSASPMNAKNDLQVAVATRVGNQPKLWQDNRDSIVASSVFLKPKLAKQEKQEKEKKKEGSGRKPAGVRGSCNVETPMTPLMPLSEGKFAGLTVDVRPTFWFYVPYNSSAIQSGQFILQDSKGKKHYRVKFEAPAEAGLVRIQLPEGKELAPQPAMYRWYFTLYCADEDSPEDTMPIFHTGTIERVQLPNLVAQLAEASIAERIALRAEQELWYDVTANLVEVRQQPDAWRRLLEVLDLTGIEQLEQAPVVQLVPLAE